MDERDVRDADMNEGIEPDVHQETSDSALERGDAEDLGRRWEQVQTKFVDDPQEAVAEADALVDEVIKRTTEELSSHRKQLEDQWARGEDATTEDLRQALQRYRSFFHRMLSTELGPAA